MTPDEIATDFYIEFNTVCQGDDTLPHDVAKWVLKWLDPLRAENEKTQTRNALLRAENEGLRDALQTCRAELVAEVQSTYEKLCLPDPAYRYKACMAAINKAHAALQSNDTTEGD